MHEICRDSCVLDKEIHSQYVRNDVVALTGIYKNDYAPRDWLIQSSNYHTVANISHESHDHII